jgi:hypothetical protein
MSDTTPQVVPSVTSCHVELREGSVTVEGVDGPDAWLDVRTPSGDAVAEGAVVVETKDGVLRVRVPETGSVASRWLAAGRRARLTVQVRVPRSAPVAVETVGAGVRLADLRGGQSVNTVTGDATIERANGRVSVHTVSGSMAVSGAAIDIQAATTSGRLRITAESLGSVQLRSVSGRIDIAGRFSRDHDHRIENLSGDVAVSTAGGVSLVTRTISGRLAPEGGARRETRSGMAVLAAGDGTASVQVTTVSGDVRLTHGAAAPVISESPSRDTDPVLEALEALARGDISVEEADRRLEVLHA